MSLGWTVRWPVSIRETWAVDRIKACATCSMVRPAPCRSSRSRLDSSHLCTTGLVVARVTSSDAGECPFFGNLPNFLLPARPYCRTLTVRASSAQGAPNGSGEASPAGHGPHGAWTGRSAEYGHRHQERSPHLSAAAAAYPTKKRSQPVAEA